MLGESQSRTPKSWTFVYSGETHTVSVGQPVPQVWFLYLGERCLLSDALQILVERRPDLRRRLLAGIRRADRIKERVAAMLSRHTAVLQDAGWHPLIVKMALSCTDELNSGTVLEVLREVVSVPADARRSDPVLEIVAGTLSDGVLRSLIDGWIVPVLVKQFLEVNGAPEV